MNQYEKQRKSIGKHFQEVQSLDFYGPQKQIWKFISQQRRRVDPISSKLVQKGTGTAYHNNGWNNKDCRSRFKEALGKLKKLKSPGEDKILTELLKYGANILNKQTQELIQKIISQNEIPDEWGRAVMLLFYKKGDRKDPNNYQGINLLNATLKLRIRIIRNKISERTIFEEEQEVFRTGRSCTNAVFIARQMKSKLQK